MIIINYTLHKLFKTKMFEMRFNNNSIRGKANPKQKIYPLHFLLFIK